MNLLLDFAQPGHVLYGSDYPFGREGAINSQLGNIDKALSMRGDALLIARNAALQLLPKFGNKERVNGD